MNHECVSVTLTKDNWSITGKYFGGVYITLRCNGKDFEVINVWDYENNKANIPLTYAAVMNEMLEWLDAVGDNFEHDMRNYLQ